MAWEDLPYDVSHFVLMAEYILLLLLSLFAVLRLRIKESLKHSWQGRFFFLLFSGCVARAVFFALQPLIREQDVCIPNKYNVAMNDLPSLLFLTAYHIILYHFVKIYHLGQAQLKSSLLTNAGRGRRSVTKLQLQMIFVCISLFMWATMVSLVVLDLVLGDTVYLTISSNTNAYEESAAIFLSAAYFFSSIAFLIYGVLVYRQFLATAPTITDKRRMIATRIRWIMIIVPLFFMSRVPMIILNMFIPDLTYAWWWDLVYFTFLELVPLVLLLTALHMDTRKDRDPRHATPRPVAYLATA